MESPDRRHAIGTVRRDHRKSRQPWLGPLGLDTAYYSNIITEYRVLYGVTRSQCTPCSAGDKSRKLCFAGKCCAALLLSGIAATGHTHRCHRRSFESRDRDYVTHFRSKTQGIRSHVFILAVCRVCSLRFHAAKDPDEKNQFSRLRRLLHVNPPSTNLLKSIICNSFLEFTFFFSLG